MPPSDDRRDSSALRQEGPQQEQLLVEVYQLAKDLWCSQCFGFTGAPEHVQRGAHEIARDGFDAICKKLGPVVHPILSAEYQAALSASRIAPQEEEIDPALETARALVEDVCECGDCDGEHSGKREHIYGPPDGPCAREGCSCEKFKAASLSVSRIPAIDSPSASRTAQAPQQALIARLTDYRAQVLNGFRHISRLEEAELIQAAIDGLRPPVAPAEGEQ